MDSKPVHGVLFHMKQGTGESSYANNSSIQRSAIAVVKPVIKESIEELLHSLSSPECLTVADLGCSSGPNALLQLFEIVHFTAITCRRLSRELPQFNVFLNDLPGNDFNNLFGSLTIFHDKVEEKRASDECFNPSCFISGTPGSFYRRLFPNNFLHFVHSAFSLHWLSQAPEGLLDKNGVPLNKGSIHLAKTSPPLVFQMYREQFRKDFTLFLSLRSKELVPGGRMVLIVIGSIGDEHDLCWESMDTALNIMVREKNVSTSGHGLVFLSQGLIPKEKLDAFNLPFYNPSANEVEELIESEGSFTLQRLQSFRLNPISVFSSNVADLHAAAKFHAQNTRAILEPILVSEFGENPMDELFRSYQEQTLGHIFSASWIQPTCFSISLAKKELA